MKPFVVIETDFGDVGYIKGFQNLIDAQSHYDNSSHYGAMIIKRDKRLRETIIAHKGLSMDVIKALMGTDKVVIRLMKN